MLKVLFGDSIEGSIIYPDRSFTSLYEPSWLDSDFARSMVEGVDKSKVNSPYSIISPVFGNMSPFMLSGSVKALLILLNTDYVVDGDTMGDNCAPWLLEIGKIKDCEITLSYFMPIKPTKTNKVLILNDNSIVSTERDFIDKHLDFF